MSFLHRRFMNFGRSTYEQTGERSGRVRLEEYEEYSPVICASGRGYYEGALKTMKVPGPIRVEERTCQCAGDPACVYELAW
jgi:predicted hydrocarbon binding protein